MIVEPLTIQFLYAFQDFISALRVNGHRRFIQNDELWFVGDAAGDI